MATLVVHVLRSSSGIHPGSAVALCVARDLANLRGAAVTALAMGDAGDRDHEVARQCAVFGADQLLFVGPPDLPLLAQRLRPRKFFAPQTPEGARFLEQFGVAERGTVGELRVDGRYSVERVPEDVACRVEAGVLPWYDLGDTLEPDYGGAFADGAPVAWLSDPESADNARIYHLSSDDALPSSLRDELGCEGVAVDALSELRDAVLLCTRATLDAQRPAVEDRHRSVRLFVLDPGGDAQLLPVSLAADVHLCGPEAAVFNALKEPAWRASLR